MSQFFKDFLNQNLIGSLPQSGFRGGFNGNRGGGGNGHLFPGAAPREDIT